MMMLMIMMMMMMVMMMMMIMMMMMMIKMMMLMMMMMMIMKMIMMIMMIMTPYPAVGFPGGKNIPPTTVRSLSSTSWFGGPFLPSVAMMNDDRFS